METLEAEPIFVESLDETSKEEKEKIRGKHITCKTCNYKFKLNEEEKLSWKKNRFECPSCKITYCNMPPTERELQTLQEEFFKNRSPEVLAKIYVILKNYISSIILKNYSNFINDKEDLEYYSHISASILIVNYKNPDFFIEYSFAGYIIWKIRESMFSKDEIECGDANIEFVYGYMSDCSIMSNTQNQLEKDDTLNYLYKYLIGLLCSKGNRELSLKLTVCFLNFIRNGEKGSDRIFRSFDVQGKNIFQNVTNTFKNKLVEMVKG